jgi:hypothetical protein
VEVTSPDIPPIPLDNLTNEYRTVMQRQALLGPNSIFFGLFVHDWLTLQEQYLTQRKLPWDKHQAASGIQALIKSLLEQVHSVWLLHNEHVQGTDPLQQLSYKQLHVLAQIRELYAAAPLMLGSDRDILFAI